MERLKKIKIGNVELQNNLILAPMAGITDLPFRKICEKFEPGLVCLEMVSSKALFYNDKKTKKLLETTNEKHPLSFQIFGSDIETMVYATKHLNDNYPIDILDINMGCPAPKIVKNGDGSSLLLNLEKSEKIINAVVNNSKVPVTIKMRTGWDKNNIVAVELAKIAEKNGISAITIHGRTRSEFYSGSADLNIIKKVKENVKTIPVIGNGDIVSEESALNMLKSTNVDGIMIGRGALGNPWIFKEINHYLETGEKLKNPTISERLDIIKEHLKLVIEHKGENGIKEFRKHLSWYTKNLKNSSEFRNKINHIEIKNELINEIEKYFEKL